jgi:hypothetical protein
MKNNKKIICLIVAVLLAISSTPTWAVEGDVRDFQSTEMSTLDVLVAAALHMNSTTVEDSLLPPSSFLKEIVPLHDLAGEVIAYYITFTTYRYAVVNNNIDNPTLIEFGEGENPLVRKILDSSTDPFIVYNSPLDVFDKNGVIPFRAESFDLFDIHPDLLEANVMAAALHSNAINYAIKLLEEQYPQQMAFASTRGDADWGFIDAGRLPIGGAIIRTITGTPSVPAIMRTFENATTFNHCGAVAVTNLALIFSNRGHTTLTTGGTYATFRAIHPRFIGNGPWGAITIAGGARNYFSSRGVTLNNAAVGTDSAMRTAIQNGRPVGLLVANGPWHWIVGVGYRHFQATGITYFQILDGWNATQFRFWRTNVGSTWISGTQYWVN